jgi:hypothetical protein
VTELRHCRDSRFSRLLKPRTLLGANEPACFRKAAREDAESFLDLTSSHRQEISCLVQRRPTLAAPDRTAPFSDVGFRLEPLESGGFLASQMPHFSTDSK